MKETTKKKYVKRGGKLLNSGLSLPLSTHSFLQICNAYVFSEREKLLKEEGNAASGAAKKRKADDEGDDSLNLKRR